MKEEEKEESTRGISELKGTLAGMLQVEQQHALNS